MHLPITGIISDKQSSLVLAAEKVFPKIPHQYCQFHYLRNVSKPFEECDLRLRKEIRKRFRSVYNTEKTIDRKYQREEIVDRNYQLLKKFYAFIKSISR